MKNKSRTQGASAAPLCVPVFRRTIVASLISVFASGAVVADEYWTGSVDGNFSNDLNWQSAAPAGDVPVLHFAGDNLLGSGVTTLNNDLVGPNFSQIQFNHSSSLVSDFTLSGNQLNLIEIYDGDLYKPGITSYAGNNTINNNIEAPVLPVYVATGSLTLNGDISLTDGGNGISGNCGIECYEPRFDYVNLKLTADAGAGLIINGDVIDNSPLNAYGSKGPRLITLSGEGVEFNGNMDISGNGSSTVVVNGSVINGSIAASHVGGDSGIYNGQVLTEDFVAFGQTSVAGTVTLDNSLVEVPEQTVGDVTYPNYSYYKNASLSVTEGNQLTLSGLGKIASSDASAPATGPNIFVQEDATLLLDNSLQASSNRIENNINVHLHRGATLNLTGNASTAVNEQIGDIVLDLPVTHKDPNNAYFYSDFSYKTAGGATVAIDDNVNLTANNLRFTKGRWLNIETAGGVLGGVAATDSSVVINQTQTLNNGILENVLINREAFATYGPNGIAAVSGPGDVQYNAGTTLPVTGATQVMNSLALNFDGQLGGTDNLEITSGHLLANGNVSIAPVVNLGAQQARIYAFGDLDFAGGVSAANGMQVSGDQLSSYGAVTNQRTVSFSGGVTLGGELGIDSATVQLATGQTANLSGGNLNNAVLDNAGTINNTGHLDTWGYRSHVINSGEINNSGDFGYVSGVSDPDNFGMAQITNTGTITNSTGSMMRADLRNEGGVVVNDGVAEGTYLWVASNNGGVIHNINGSNTRGYYRSNNGTLNNEAGSVFKSSGQDAQISNGSVINNAGDMEFITRWWGLSHNLTIDGTSVLNNTGTITFTGGDLIIKNGDTFTQHGTIVLNEECAGAYDCYGGSLIVSGNTSPFVWRGDLTGNLSAGPDSRNSGVIRGEASVAINIGTIIGNAYVTTNNGYIYGDASGSGFVNYGYVEGNASGFNSSSGVVGGNFNGQNDGTVGGALDGDNNGTVNGTMLSGHTNNGTVNGRMVGGINNGTVNFTQDGSVSSFTNNGDVTVSSSADVTFSGSNTNAGSIVNNGSVVVSTNGVLAGIGTYQQLSGDTIVNGAINQDVTIDGGTIGGSGTINGDLAVNFGGTVGPGSSPGDLSINGDLFLAPGGTLAMEVLGNNEGEYDRIFVSRNYALSGGDIVFDLGSGISFDFFLAKFKLQDFFRKGTLETNWGANSDWFTAVNFSANLFDGTTVNFSVEDFAPVPVPAAIWLFGSGLLGLVGVARRRKAA